MSNLPAYRVGILGFGFIGKVHAHAYQTLPFFYDPLPCRTRITHVCTAHADSAARAAALLGAQGTTDWRGVVENPEVDIINICTPNDCHLEPLLAAMAGQKHVYCDKPLVVDLAQARRVQAARAGYRGTAQMTFNNRFVPALMRAKQLVDEGWLGQVLEARLAYLHASNVDPATPLKWKLSAAAGGGVIADLASHVLDLATWLLGEPSELVASTQVAYAERPAAGTPAQRVPVDAEDQVMLLLRLPGGALAQLAASKLTTGAEDEVRVELHGSRGALRYHSADPHHLEVYDQGAPAAPLGGLRGWTRVDCGQRYPAPANGFPSPKVPLGWLRVHTACLHAFLSAVAAGAPGAPGLTQGLGVQRQMEALRLSAREHRWVRLDEEALAL